MSSSIGRSSRHGTLVHVVFQHALPFTQPLTFASGTQELTARTPHAILHPATHSWYTGSGVLGHALMHACSVPPGQLWPSSTVETHHEQPLSALHDFSSECLPLHASAGESLQP